MKLSEIWLNVQGLPNVPDATKAILQASCTDGKWDGNREENKFLRKVFAVYSEGEADLADEMNAAKEVVVKQRQTREEREAKKRAQVWGWATVVWLSDLEWCQEHGTTLRLKPVIKLTHTLKVTPSSSNTTEAAGDAPKKKQVRDSACVLERDWGVKINFFVYNLLANILYFYCTVTNPY